jgi:hypothetical protein
MASWAKPGVKCVCIRKSRWISGGTMLPTEFGPKFEEVLTIAVVVAPTEIFGMSLHFVEYPVDLEGNPPVYPVREFKPLVDRDISLFTHHLDDEKADA